MFLRRAGGCGDGVGFGAHRSAHPAAPLLAWPAPAGAAPGDATIVARQRRVLFDDATFVREAAKRKHYIAPEDIEDAEKLAASGASCEY